MRITLIHNPHAGKQEEDEAKALRKLLKSAGHEVRYRSAKDEDWKRALKKPAELIVIAGGDGTVGKVARRMVGRGVPLALLPSGTANNVARSLGLIEQPFEALVRGWENARRVKLDVGIATGPWGERTFIEGIGAGLFANLLAEPHSEKLKERAAAVEAGLGRLREHALHSEPLEITARLDGEDISGRYVMFEAINIAYIGPNLHLAQESQPGDGHFDVLLVTDAERDRVIHYLEHWQDNPDRISVLPSRRGRHLEFEWPGFPLHIDDKLYPGPKAKPKEIAGLAAARIGDEAIEFLVPA
ncbi:MAG: diacylglycerol kinase family protein [Burkholderiales bacterium]